MRTPPRPSMPPIPASSTSGQLRTRVVSTSPRWQHARVGLSLLRAFPPNAFGLRGGFGSAKHDAVFTDLAGANTLGNLNLWFAVGAGQADACRVE